MMKITKYDEELEDLSEVSYIDPLKPWKRRSFKGCRFVNLQKQVFKDGRFTGTKKSVQEIAGYVKKQLDNEIWIEEQRFEYPHRHYLDMTPAYYEMKRELLASVKE